jgi:hypothetical protein
LIEKVAKLCADNAIAVKPQDRWGVTLENDNRMTPKKFGDYKTSVRLKTEAKAIDFVQNPGLFGGCAIAGTIAASGTGKTRLLDDLARVPLLSPHFKYILRIPISFNDTSSRAYVHPLSVRLLFQFVCGTSENSAATNVNVAKAMLQIDALLAKCSTKDADIVAGCVLDAIEAVYYSMHGGVLGRTMLLVDELACARFLPNVNAEAAIYETLKQWLNGGVVGVGGASRRGVVFTGLTVASAWTKTSPIVWLPLGTFDVWDNDVRAAIQAQTSLNWPGCRPIQPKVWALLAATGGRPRDIFNVLEKVHSLNDNLGDHHLISLLYTDVRSELFASYLLPALLNVRFNPYARGVPTLFGKDASSMALLNSDCLTEKQRAVPMVSLRFVDSLPSDTDDRAYLRNLVRDLVSTLIFYEGKDLECAWALLTLCVLQLQFLVRCSDSTDYWPCGSGKDELGGPSCLTAGFISVFAGHSRVEALFSRPRHVFVGPGSIHRKVVLTDSPPTLALWRDLWTTVVQPGSAVPDGWPAQVQLDVEWRSPCIVFFENVTHKAVDFMLLVGRSGGTGEDEPHAYMFQAKAWANNMAQVDVNSAVVKLERQLGVLFAPEMAMTNVLRKAGVRSARQVTLCLAAITFGKVEFKKSPPFSIVLFDGAEFKSMCGGAFCHTAFCHQVCAEQ